MRSSALDWTHIVRAPNPSIWYGPRSWKIYIILTYVLYGTSYHRTFESTKSALFLLPLSAHSLRAYQYKVHACKSRLCRDCWHYIIEDRRGSPSRRAGEITSHRRHFGRAICSLQLGENIESTADGDRGPPHRTTSAVLRYSLRSNDRCVMVCRYNEKVRCDF